MTLRNFFCFATLATLGTFAGPLGAQTAAEPAAYTVTVNDFPAGATAVTKTYRLGSKVLVEQRGPRGEVNGSDLTTHQRTLYDFATMKSLRWDPDHDSVPCERGIFTAADWRSGSGDDYWGDPFVGSDRFEKEGAKQMGAETIHGFATRIWANDSVKVWVDTRTGLVMKLQMLMEGGSLTIFRVTDVSLTPPPASVFEIPPNCVEFAVVPQVVTEAQRAHMAAHRTEPPGAIGMLEWNALVGPASKNSCTMLFQAVGTGSNQPVTVKYQVAVDLTVATGPAPHYTVRLDGDGRATFSGGGLHEIAAEGPDGVFHVYNVPEEFVIDVEFGDAGSASARIYRQCFATYTELKYLAGDPSRLERRGNWVWDKPGMYKTLTR